MSNAIEAASKSSCDASAYAMLADRRASSQRLLVKRNNCWLHYAQDKAVIYPGLCSFFSP